MKQTLFSTTTYPVTKLIQDIDLGEIALPDMQRPFVWKGFKRLTKKANHVLDGLQ